MGLFNQFADIVEWNESREDVLFWKWSNKELKKGTKVVIRPGQDAIFLYNGKIEGIFKEEGNYAVESDIIPFLSTLKGFKFGFNSGIRAEVLFVNTKEFIVKWGTKNSINIPTQSMPGGMPIRCFGTYSFKIEDYICLIDKIAGIKQQFSVDDVKERTTTVLDQLLMKWIVKEGKDMFNLQANSFEICNGMKEDLNSELLKIGLVVSSLNIESFSYPEKIQEMIDKNAAYGMVNANANYQTVSMLESMEKNPSGSMAGNMAQMGMGMKMGMNMMDSMEQNFNRKPQSQDISSENGKNEESNFIMCSQCNAKLDVNAKFCGNCGTKVEKQALVSDNKFCPECGAKVSTNSRFCGECGNKL